MLRRLRMVLAAALALVGCDHHPAEAGPQPLRVGLLPNVTHAVALSARGRKSFERALAPTPIEWKAFGAGPQAAEALLAGALDVAYLGPGPAANAFVRSRGEAVVVIAGAASGGAALVVRKGLGIRGPQDLHRRKLADPQIGNTQDVALRTWLEKNGLRTTDRGGDVLVLPLANADILNLVRRGDLDGAWVAEPWVTRLVDEAGCEVLVDEATLWPDGRYPTTLLVAARPALATRSPEIRKLVAAHVDEVKWDEAHPAELAALVRAGLESLGGKRLPAALVERSLQRVHPTWDPMPGALARLADDAHALGYLPVGGADPMLAGLLDKSLLDAALAGGRP